MSNAFVICMGMGVVFTGLICIVLLVTLMGKIVQSVEKKVPADQAGMISEPKKTAQAIGEPIANRGELAAAISAVLAEELGTSVAGLRILSIKKIN